MQLAGSAVVAAVSARYTLWSHTLPGTLSELREPPNLYKGHAIQKSASFNREHVRHLETTTLTCQLVQLHSICVVRPAIASGTQNGCFVYEVRLQHKARLVGRLSVCHAVNCAVCC